MEGLIDLERKGWESIIHDHGRGLWVNMVGRVGVRDSDRGVFRRRRTVDTLTLHWRHNERLKSPASQFFTQPLI